MASISATLLAMTVGAVPHVAHACRTSSSQTSILHRVLPVLPKGVVAAEVEITTDIRSPARPPLEARIISMIKGGYKGRKLRIAPQIISSCDGFPYPGSRGFAVGRVLLSSKDVLVIDPIREPSANDRMRQSKRDAVAYDMPTPARPD